MLSSLHSCVVASVSAEPFAGQREPLVVLWAAARFTRTVRHRHHSLPALTAHDGHELRSEQTRPAKRASDHDAAAVGCGRAPSNAAHKCATAGHDDADDEAEADAAVGELADADTETLDVARGAGGHRVGAGGGVEPDCNWPERAVSAHESDGEPGIETALSGGRGRLCLATKRPGRVLASILAHSSSAIAGAEQFETELSSSRAGDFIRVSRISPSVQSSASHSSELRHALSRAHSLTSASSFDLISRSASCSSSSRHSPNQQTRVRQANAEPIPPSHSESDSVSFVLSSSSSMEQLPLSHMRSESLPALNDDDWASDHPAEISSVSRF